MTPVRFGAGVLGVAALFALVAFIGTDNRTNSLLEEKAGRATALRDGVE